MMSIRKGGAILSLAVAAAAFGFGQAAYAQQAGPGTDKANPDAPVGQHMGGGTVPGPGTHGHSSSAKAGETKDIQERQHNMPATPPHSSGPPKR
jgi:hypothetical protein